MKYFFITIAFLFLVCSNSIIAQFEDTIIVYPQNTQFWTGATDGTTKTDGEVNTIFPNDGWMVFDLSSIPPLNYVTSIQFYGYLNANNFPYWSITPMGSVNPVTDDAGSIYNQINNNYQEGIAYSHNLETGTLPTGWLSRTLETSAPTDLYNAQSQGWFAIGFVDFDFYASYYINFDGWSQNNPPYLVVTGEICYVCPLPPSNLTAQVIFNPGPQVQLNWQDNSTNEIGFIIARKYGLPNEPGNYMTIGSVGVNTIEYIDTTVLPESTYTYKVYSFNYYGSSPSNTAWVAVPIPVELISFMCEVENDAVILTWQTATEKNNQGFEIESEVGSKQSVVGSWEKIGFVEGNGTTTERKYYSFTDRPEPGKYKYRLKQIDFNGSFEYSSEVEAEILSPLVFSLEQNYPNPFNPSTTIKFEIPNVETTRRFVFTTLKVYDIIGNEVATLVNEEKQPGIYEVNFDGSALSSGVYLYRLTAGIFSDIKKLVLLK